MSNHFEQTRYKQLYHSLVDNSPFGYAYHEIMVNELGEPVDYRFLEANEAFENLTGLCVKDILGQRVTEVLPGIRDGDFDWVAFYGKVALEGKSEIFEHYSAPLNKWYKVHAWSSEKGFFITSFVDITKERDHLKSAFLATISHELRTLLTSIIGFSDLMRSSVDNEQDREQAAIIHDSGKEFLAMVEDIFDLALVEGGRVKIRNQTFKLLDLHGSAQNTLEELLTELGKAGQVKAVYRPDEELMEKTITCDRIKIIQVLTNLLQNAVKFTEKGSIEFGYYSEKADQLTFYVKDTGVGIPEEKRDVLFDIFRQVDESDTRQFGGLGIGLAISKRITEALKGSLSVESKPGEGSVFYFTLPVQFSESVAVGESDDKPRTGPVRTKNTVMIVEDYENTRTLIKLALEGTDIHIIEAENGREAVAQFENNPDIDLILMDLKMPVMDGFTATQKIIAIRPDVDIIAVTAYSSESDREKAIACGCTDVVSKPFDIALLVSTIDNYLNKS